MRLQGLRPWEGWFSLFNFKIFLHTVKYIIFYVFLFYFYKFIHVPIQFLDAVFTLLQPTTSYEVVADRFEDLVVMKKMALKHIESMDNCPCILPLTTKLKKRVEELEKQMARISEKVNLKNNLNE
jgi:hypothetical protein